MMLIKLVKKRKIKLRKSTFIFDKKQNILIK